VETGHLFTQDGVEKEELILAKGFVKWFDTKKGYGFIEQPGGDDIFVHYTGIAGDGFRSLRAGKRWSLRFPRAPRGSGNECSESKLTASARKPRPSGRGACLPAGRKGHNIRGNTFREAPPLGRVGLPSRTMGEEEPKVLLVLSFLLEDRPPAPDTCSLWPTAKGFSGFTDERLQKLWFWRVGPSLYFFQRLSQSRCPRTLTDFPVS